MHSTLTTEHEAKSLCVFQDLRVGFFKSGNKASKEMEPKMLLLQGTRAKEV